MWQPPLDFPYQTDLPYPFYRPAPDTERPCIFVHIPKTGGTSMRRVLALPPPQRKLGLIKHIAAQRIFDHLPPDNWQAAFKFTFVRHPFTRLVSHYYYRLREQRIQQRYGRELSFREWVKLALTSEEPGNLRPQYHWVYSDADQLLVDFTGRFETMEKDFAQVLRAIGKEPVHLPHLNKRSKRIDYADLYDHDTRVLVQDFYAEDFRRFGYSPEVFP